MATYKITLTFSANPVDQDFLEISDGLSNPVIEHTLYTPPSSSGTNGAVIYQYDHKVTVYNLAEAFRIAYNLGGIYTTAKINTGGDAIFTITGDFTNSPFVTSVPTNMTWSVDPVDPPIIIEGYGWEANASSVCNLIDVTITTNISFDTISWGEGDITFPATTSYTAVGLDRDRFYKFTITSTGGSTTTLSKVTPSYMNTGLISIDVLNNTVVITDSFNLLTVEYSLDGTNYQPENVFNNLTAGDYTVYLRDQFGCVITDTFTIQEGDDGEITVLDPYFIYSKANPIRMATREEWDNLTVFKNDSNTLS